MMFCSGSGWGNGHRSVRAAAKWEDFCSVFVCLYLIRHTNSAASVLKQNACYGLVGVKRCMVAVD